jgi:EAL domain-containing protein (putative c-di-GMP-specific phosphodiesterase class I)
VDELLSILDKYHTQTNEIMIEITERSIIDNFEGTQDIITALKREGIHCAIDDFGVGYSSLSYLKKLSFDTLKIDREFIKDIQYRPDDIILIRTILDIGRQFKYDIVVEGIEEVKQKELLLEIDQNLIYQGFLLDKPMSFERFIQKYLHK